MGGRRNFLKTDPQPLKAVDPVKKAAEERRISELEKKLQNKNEVLSELMEVHMNLKKSLGEL